MERKNGKQEAKKTPQFQFFGENKNPDELEKVLERKFIPGDGKIPDELKVLKNTKSIYLQGDIPIKPEMPVTKIKDNDGELWKIELSVGENVPFTEVHRSVVSEIREDIDTIQKQIDNNISFNSHRPSWIDANFSPTFISEPPLNKIKSINGKDIIPYYIFPPDDRKVFCDASWPRGVVGRVITSGGKTGTAVLVGRRTIVTVGHVWPWGNQTKWMKFVPAYYDGVSLHGVGVESYVSHVQGYNTGGSTSAAGHDYIVCRLFEQLGEYYGYFGFNGYSNSWNNKSYWSIIGYPDDVASGRRPSFQDNISVEKTHSDSTGGLEMETKADLNHGNSGGPMYAWWEGDPRVVGVVVGGKEYSSPGFWPWQWGNKRKINVVAGGSAFCKLIAWARTNWP